MRIGTICILLLAAAAAQAESWTGSLAENLTENQTENQTENRKDSVKARTIDEVVVTGARQQTEARHLPMTVNVISREVLNEQQRTSLLPTIMEQVPGLFVTSRGMLGYGLSAGASGKISLRGLGGGEGRMMVLIDGHPQYNGVFNHPIADSYQTMMAERVEVLRGPASMIYGSDAMGGVINIVTHGQPEDGVRTHINLGAGSYGTFQSSVSNSVRHKGFTSHVAAQYNRSDNHRPNMGFEQYGGHLNLGYDFNNHWHAFADADVTHFNASNPGAVASPVQENDQWITRGAVNAGVENHFDRSSGAVTAFSNFGWHKINDGYGPTTHKNTPQTEFFRSKDALSGLSLYQSACLFEGNRITVGLDYLHIYGRAYYTSRATGEVVDGMGASGDNRKIQSSEKHRNEVAGYVNVHQDLFRRLSLDAGVRYDYHSTSGGEWVPQGGLVVRPFSDAELKAVVGKGFRHPNLRELYMYGTANEELAPERIMNYELSWHHRLADNRLTYDLNLFYIKGDNLIQVVVLSDGKQRNINTGVIENCGAEAEVTWRINHHWQISTNHSLLHMKNPIVAAPEYKGYLGANFSAGRWSATLGLQQINGLYTAVGADAKQENCTLLNASTAFRATKFLQLWLRGENLLAQRYEINAGYPMPKATFMAGVNVTL